MVLQKDDAAGIPAAKPEKEKASFVCVKDTLDGAYPSLMLAINASRQGLDTKIFYSFAGLNLVKKGGVESARYVPTGPMGAIPGMSRVATGMMKKKIDKAEIPSLAELQEMAQLEGVELIACKMSIDMYELDPEALVEGVTIWNADEFMSYAAECKICLFT